MGFDHVGRVFYGVMDFSFNPKKFYNKFGIYPSDKAMKRKYFDEGDWYNELEFNDGIEDVDRILEKKGSDVMVSTTFASNKFVCIRASHMKISRIGFAKFDNFPRTVSLDKWDVTLKEFCIENGIEWKQPSWVVSVERW